MKSVNRDILVLTNQSHLSRQELELHVAQLNALLYHVESWNNFCTANEIIDINHRRILCKPHLIQKAIRDTIAVDKPCVFLNNKN